MSSLSRPRVRVDVEGIERRGAGWRVIWRIEDQGPRPLTIAEAWHPHSRFRSSRLARSLRIAPRSSASLEVPARMDAAPAERIENCFLILRARSGGRGWRILTRFTVETGDEGVPAIRVEAVDVHAAGA